MASASAFMFLSWIANYHNSLVFTMLALQVFLFFKSLQKIPSSWVGAVQEISYMLTSFLGLEFIMQNDAHHE